MGIIYRVAAITGTYKDSEGNEKKRYADLGVVMDTKNGPMLKIEQVPVGWDGWAYLNEPKDKEAKKPAQTKPSADPFDDENLPF